MNEESRVLRAQNDILITNNRAMAAGKHKFNLYGKTLQIFRFPKSHLLWVGQHRRRDRNILNLAGVAIHSLFPGRGARHRGICLSRKVEWDGPGIGMNIVDAAVLYDSVGLTGIDIGDEIGASPWLFYSDSVAGTVDVAL